MAYKLSFIIAVACLAGIAVAIPTTTVSYIQDIQVSFENGRWTCGAYGCPLAPPDPVTGIAGTFGCRVQRQTNADDNTKLDTIYTCFDVQKRSLAVASSTIDMYRVRDIYIDLESYVGASSVYSTGYGLGGTEKAKGVVAPDGWTELKKDAANNKKAVEESNAQVA